MLFLLYQSVSRSTVIPIFFCFFDLPGRSCASLILARPAWSGAILAVTAVALKRQGNSHVRFTPGNGHSGTLSDLRDDIAAR